MSKITWVNFLHIYQPPWQDKGIIEQVAASSYEYLIRLFKRYPNFKASLNISGNLVEQLEIYRPDLLRSLGLLLKKGQIELTATAHYHALLPLISPTEAKRQIELNQGTLAKYFALEQIKGFYLPEMAFDNRVAKLIKSLGFEWLILDPINFKEKLAKDTLYLDNVSGLKIIFRDRKISKGYPPEVIFKKISKIKNNETIITATDGEIYGHFHTDWQGHLEQILQNKNLEIKTVGQYIASLKTKQTISLRAGSWESSEIELEKKIPFVLWADPKNKIHKNLWLLAKQASQLVTKYKKDANWQWARQHLDRGLSSCTFWWASAKKPSEFSSLTWNPDMIDKGSEELIKSIRSLTLASPAEKIKAEKIYLEIKKNTWFDHWRKYNKK
ncbi:MAG: hypothetical protein Q8O32_03470 [bacterium]|nr:hypothetical protein [bacterium]